MKRTTAAVTLAAGAIGLPGPVGAAGAQEAAAFTLEGSTRGRYETLSAPFRAGRTGSDQQLSWRTRVLGEYDAGAVTFGAELFDSRAWLTDDGSVLSATAINTLDVTQAYVRLELDRAELQAGRFVMSVGSRRLAGENSFRNWPNTFEGVRGAFALSGTVTLEAFFTNPVEPSPSDRASLLDNEHAFDEADRDTRFWAAHLKRERLFSATHGEIYVFGLNEDGGSDLLTLGARLERPAAPTRFDYDLEAMWQTGETGAALDVSAAAAHLEAGYSFAGAWSPRLSAQLVYASGDEDPADGEFNRFDRLYGLRRGALGQTGIMGPLDVENIVAVGVRGEIARGPLNAHLLVQDLSLASDTDRWRRAGLRDASGLSGGRVGQIVDSRVGWEIAEDRLRLEGGAAVLFKGEFAQDAPGAPEDETPIYTYAMLTALF